MAGSAERGVLSGRAGGSEGLHLAALRPGHGRRASPAPLQKAALLNLHATPTRHPYPLTPTLRLTLQMTEGRGVEGGRRPGQRRSHGGDRDESVQGEAGVPARRWASTVSGLRRLRPSLSKRCLQRPLEQAAAAPWWPCGHLASLAPGLAPSPAHRSHGFLPCPPLCPQPSGDPRALPGWTELAG